jgi:4-amino-4-deoxy-L-arabinose transferase-like glycosyltransferase
MYTIALAAWRGVFGSSVTALRLLSVACGLLTVALLFAAARRWFGDRQALVTMLLAATSALAVYYSQEVRPYALVLMLASLVMVAACGRARWALAAAAGVGFLGSFLVGILIVAVAIAELLVYRHPRAWLRRWYPAVLAMLPALGLYLLASVVRDPGSVGVAQRTGALIRNALFVPYGLLVGTTYGPPVEALHYGDAMALLRTHAIGLGVLAVVVIILAVGLIAVLRRGVLGDRERQRGLVLLLTFVFAVLGSVVVAVATGVNWLPRHSICALVPLDLLLPLTAWRLWYPVEGARRRRSAVAIASAACLVALVAMNAMALLHYYADDAYARSDYRAASDYLKQRPAALPVVLLYGQADLLGFYGLPGVVDGRTISREHLRRDLVAHGLGHRGLYLVVDMEYYYWGDPGTPVGIDRMAALLGPGYRVLERRTWGSFSVYRVEPATSSAPSE